MPVGTVLMTSRAGVGNMGILSLPAATNQGFQSMIPNEDIPSYFLFSMHEIIRSCPRSMIFDILLCKKRV